MGKQHTGRWRYHDDDCRCVEGDLFCNRDGHCWSCCGAAQEDSDCTAPEMHPTNPSHPVFAQTVAGFRDGRACFKPKAEVEALYRRWKLGRS